MRTIFSLFVIVLVLGLTSCKKDSKDPAGCSGYWATEVEAELNALIAASSAYSSNQTAETCTAYKDAYLDYLDAIRPFLDCSTLTAADREELQNAIDDSEAAMEALNCDI